MNHPLLSELSEELLKEGKTIKLQVTGLSMFPTIRSGDFVYIESLKNSLPQIGQVLFFKDAAQRLVLHRLVALEKANGVLRLVAKGDGYTKRLDPLSLGQILGLVTFVERRGIKQPLPLRKPGWFLQLYAFIYYWLVRFARSE